MIFLCSNYSVSRSYGMPDVDEDELEAELDALGDEIALDDDASYLGRKSVHTYSIVHP